MGSYASTLQHLSQWALQDGDQLIMEALLRAFTGRLQVRITARNGLVKICWDARKDARTVNCRTKWDWHLSYRFKLMEQCNLIYIILLLAYIECMQKKRTNFSYCIMFPDNCEEINTTTSIINSLNWQKADYCKSNYLVYQLSPLQSTKVV